MASISQPSHSRGSQITPWQKKEKATTVCFIYVSKQANSRPPQTTKAKHLANLRHKPCPRLGPQSPSGCASLATLVRQPRSAVAGLTPASAARTTGRRRSAATALRDDMESGRDRGRVLRIVMVVVVLRRSLRMRGRITAHTRLATLRCWIVGRRAVSTSPLILTMGTVYLGLIRGSRWALCRILLRLSRVVWYHLI